MTELSIWQCDRCGHIFTPREHRWSIDGTSSGSQRCYPCARSHNDRAAMLNALI